MQKVVRKSWAWNDGRAGAEACVGLELGSDGWGLL